MNAEEEIDKNINLILMASGSALKYYSNQKTIGIMRDIMRNIMSKSYIAGVDSARNILKGKE